MAFDLLSSCRVLELSTEIAGPYAGKLLVDAGADVVKLEPPGLDALRGWSASGAELGGYDSALFQHLNAGKRIISGPVSDDMWMELVAGVDAVVESGQLSVQEIDRLRATLPALSILSTTPFGRRGPWTDRPATEFTLQAECGAMASRGLPEREPLQVGGRFGEWVTGVCSATALVAALYSARHYGQGEHVDVSMFECMAAMIGGRQPLSGTLGGVVASGPPRSVEMPAIEPSADGYVGICCNTAQQFRDFLAMIGRADLVDDTSLASFAGRWARREEFWSTVRAWTTRHTTAEIVDLANNLRIPAVPVGPPDTFIGLEHFVDRAIFGTAPGGRFLAPRIPYLVDGRADRSEMAAHTVGVNDVLSTWGRRKPHAPSPDGSHPVPVRRLPFDGLRILDFTSFWAGPSAARFFASLGADVIHVESIQHPDGYRFITMRTTELPDQWWERSVGFQQENANKRGITLDLGDPRGRELLLRLVEQSDVFMENYSPRVLDNFGITHQLIQSHNPNAVVLRMPAFGLSGPWRDRTGFASTMEAATGLAWITGYRDGPPTTLRGPLDPVSGMHAAFALAASLLHRSETGEAHMLETPMVDVALNMSAELIIEHSAYGALLCRDGNRGPYAAPQGVYRCKGEECWLALAVANDEQWCALRKAIGNPDWASPTGLDTASGRRKAHDEIDEHLGKWAADISLDDAVELLLSNGVPAGRVVDGLDLLSNEQLRFRGYYEVVDSPLLGHLDISSHPFRFSSRSEAWITRPAPTLGEHTREILTSLLGLSDDELEDLEVESVIGRRPLHL